MKTFATVAAQGEITVVRLKDTKAHPRGYTALTSNGKYAVVGHSETGHHHVVDARHASIAVKDTVPEGMRVLHMIVSQTTSLDHLRPHDTHESLRLEPGTYELRIGREYDPYADLARQSKD